MADFNVAWTQRIQVGFLYEYVPVHSLSHSVKMDGGSMRRWPSWKNLKRRIGWKPINVLCFCRPSKWAPDTSAGEEPMMIPYDQSPTMLETINQGSCIGQTLPGDGIMMNLATALVADSRGINVGSMDWMTVKPLKSIARRDVKVAHDSSEDGGGIGTLCCLIPCGHTYFRVCSRSMWSKQEPCPLCNRSIIDILEIF